MTDIQNPFLPVLLGITQTGAVGVVGFLSLGFAISTTTMIGRRIYPLSPKDESNIGRPEWFGAFKKPTDYFESVGRIRISKQEYEALSTVRKVVNSVTMFFVGAFTGAATGFLFTASISLSLFVPIPVVPFVGLGTLFSTIVGGVIGIAPWTQHDNGRY